MSDSFDPMGWSSPDSSVHGILYSWSTEVSYHCLFPGIFPARDQPASLESPTLASRFFTASATWEALRHAVPPQ